MLLFFYSERRLDPSSFFAMLLSVIFSQVGLIWAGFEPPPPPPPTLLPPPPPPPPPPVQGRDVSTARRGRDSPEFSMPEH